MASILIVDDIADNRKFLVAVLRRQGYELIEAADGSEALAAARAERPDLVITDVLMPVMDGYELVRQLQLDPATSGIPVVFHTAHYGEREARELATSRGVSYVLAKPAEPEEVSEIVRRGLAGNLAEPIPTGSRSTEEIDREHIRLVTGKLSETDRELRAANARLRAMINIGLELSSEQDADQLLRRVCDASRDLFGATSVTLAIVDPDSGRVHRFATCGLDEGRRLVPGEAIEGILATVVAERRSVRGVNPGGVPALVGLPPFHPEVQAFLAAPIASPTRVYGWICFIGNEGRAFTEDDEHLVMALAGHVGRVYASNHLHAIAQERTEALEREIAARNLAQLELASERDRAQRYLDTADVILLALDTRGRITLANRYACDVFGWSADELLGRDFIETCVPSAIRAETRLKLGKVLTGPDSSIVDNAIITRSGEERLIEWRNTLLRDAEGRVVSTLSSGTDLTERNRAVDALRVTEERTRFALQNAGVGIWDIDYTTGVLRWSEILEAQYGLEPGTFDGTFDAFARRIHPDDRAYALDTFAKSSVSGADFSLQHRAVWADGTVRWLSGSGRIHLGGHGEPLRGVGISLDITERRSLEAQVQQAQKMEAIGQLAGGVAHDFNNLLTAILGYCELLLTELESGDPRRADVAEIQKAGVSAAALTQQLLAFSRKEIIEPKLIDLNAVVRGVRALLGRLIGEDVQVVLNLRPEAVLVTADRAQLEQIVMNLAVNARDAMPLGGTLTVGTALVELDEQYAQAHQPTTPGRYVALTVTDTGSGMSQAVQARLFEPFFTTKGPGKGTGLGLATVHGIATRGGGSVDVHSEVGKGTSFTVHLPHAETDEAIVECPPPDPRPRDAGQTILVVDDAEGLRDLTRRLLQRQGYVVLVAGNAAEASRLFDRQGTVDLLLTDVVMPGGSGPELSAQLTARQPSLKVVYMSGYTEDAIAQRGVVTPGIAFLHKPFTSESLGRKIREVLDQ